METLVILYTPDSNSYHERRNCDSSTLATPCEIRSQSDCGIGPFM
jgi:hypothetical protein